MSEKFLPFCRPNITDEDIEAVVGVLRSGWITTGPQNSALEKMFCDLTGAQCAVLLNSATAALHLYLLAKSIGPGDEVITPSLTWVSTANIVTLVGANPVFVDVDRDNLMVTADVIERAITPRTKLIIPVHFAGAALDLDPIRALAKARNIAVLEDAAHALGTNYKNVPVGRDGDAIFSLQAIKNVTAAEGGVFVTHDVELAQRIRSLRFHGLGVDAYDRQTHGRNPQAEVIEPGFKYNLPDMCAALAVSQLQRLSGINAKRAELAAYYREQLQTVPVQPLTIPAWSHRHSWHLFVVRIEPTAAIDRDRFIERMKENGIGCGIHFRAIHQQKYYRQQKDGREHPQQPLHDLRNTEWNSARICSLPLFPDMTLRDVDRVVAAIRSILG